MMPFADSYSKTSMKRDFVIDQLTIPEKFLQWIYEYVTEPIDGFEHKINIDGSPYTRKQQINETRKQAIAIVYDFLKRGKSEGEILKVLYLFK